MSAVVPALELETHLASVARSCHVRGWALGTSGNFSAVISRNPFRMTISSSGFDKSTLSPEHFVHVNAEGTVTSGTGKPSAETALHLLITRALGAGAVLHTHSVWNTMLSGHYAAQSGLWIEQYEMLKGLEGVKSHQHREWLPVFQNDQDMKRLSGIVETELRQRPEVHGFLLERHGLYTWGKDLAQAKRHLEILEFLLEVLARTHFAANAGG